MVSNVCCLLTDWVQISDFIQNYSSSEAKENQPFSLILITPWTYPEFNISWNVTGGTITTSRKVDSEDFVQINSTLTFSNLQKNQKGQMISANASREGRVEYTFVFKIIIGKKLKLLEIITDILK